MANERIGGRGIYGQHKNFNLRYELKPNASFGYISINSDGFRDKDYSLSKDKGVLRILVIGDSVTFGKSLRLEDTFPKKLQTALEEKCRLHNFEVFNMGVEGYNTIQEYEFLKVKGLKYSPDLVLLYYCYNDPDYPEYYFQKNFFNRYFLSARYIQYRIKKFLVKRDRKLKGIKNEVDNFRYLYNSPSWGYTKEAILNIKSLSKRYHFKFVLGICQEMSSLVLDFGDKYPYAYINKMLVDFCGKNNIDIIDPLDYMKKRNDNPLDLVIDYKDRHHNTKGHGILASFFAEELIKRKIISCFVP